MHLVSFTLLAFSSLLAIVDPIAAVPLFLALTADYTREHRRATLRTAIITATLVLMIFAVLGTAILRFFGVTTEAFRITGGLLFLGVGAEMLRGTRSVGKTTPQEQDEAASRQEVAVIPLGLPTLAGPGAITTVVTLNAQAPALWHHLAIQVAIIAVMVVAWVALAIAPAVFHRLGQTGLNIVTRVMGLIVMVIGTQFIIDGIRTVVLSILH
jgi:multiple antibiotic resistance protein